jgi:hypothetical protein
MLQDRNRQNDEAIHGIPSQRLSNRTFKSLGKYAELVA